MVAGKRQVDYCNNYKIDSFFSTSGFDFYYRRPRPKIHSSISQMPESAFKPAVSLPIRLLLRPLQLYPLTRKERSVIEAWGIASGRLRRHKAIPDRWVQVLQHTINQTRKKFFCVRALARGRLMF